MLFKVGDRVKIKESGKTGEVTNLFPSEYWNLMAGGGDDEYTVKLDDGDGAINFRESLLELIDAKKCTCGLVYARSGGRHSDWCDLYTEV